MLSSVKSNSNLCGKCLHEIEAESRTLSFKKGNIIFHKNESIGRLYLVTKGLMGLVDTAKNGEESLLRVFGERDYFGYRTFLNEEEDSIQANVVALSDVKLIMLPFTSSLELQVYQPKLFLHLVSLLSNDLKNAERRMSSLVGKQVFERLIEGLLYLNKRFPNYTLSRKQLGDFCGATSETIARKLTDLENEGLIKRIGRKVSIVDEQKLLSVIR